MQITIVTRHDLYPAVHGGAVKIVRTAEALSALGHGVTVVTGDRLHYHRYDAGAHTLVDYPPRFVAATRVPPRLLPLLRRLGLPDYWRTVEGLLDSLGYPRDEHILYQGLVDPDFWLRAVFVGLRHKTDWFQAEFPGFGAPAWVAARALGARVAVVEHNIEWKRLADMCALGSEQIERFRGIEVQLLHLADEVITCSDDDRTLLLDDDFARREVSVIPHGVDLARYDQRTGVGFRQRHGVRDSAQLLFFHGTLHYLPNAVACQVLAGELLPRLRARGRDVQVIAAGMSPPSEARDPDLILPGVVDDLPAAVRAADLCVVPLLDGGGTRMKILEYFAGERAVVSTRKGAEGLAAEHGRHIHLVDDGDWAAFADAVEQLLDDPARRAGLARGGRSFVESYDWSAVAGAFIELYEGREAVRGADFNRRFAAAAPRDPRPVEQIGAELLAERSATARGRSRHERKGRGDIPLPPRWGDVTHELGEDDIVAHLPVTVTPTKGRTLILMLSERCNLKCDFCDLWRSVEMMPWEHAEAVIRRAPAAGVSTVVLTGGEPFLHPRIHDLIELCHALGLGVNITSNGTLLRRELDRLEHSPVDSISVSLDGLRATHDRLRGREGSWDEAVAGLKALKDRTDISLSVYFVVTNENVAELVDVFDYARGEGFGFDFWPVNGAPDLYITSPEDQASYRAAVDHIAAADPAVARRRDYYAYGLEYMAGRRDHLRCLGLNEQFGVNHRGELVACCVWDSEDLKVGSAVDRPLDELLFSQQAQDLRERIVSQGCYDQCFNHSLYEFQLATGLPFVVPR